MVSIFIMSNVTLQSNYSLLKEHSPIYNIDKRNGTVNLDGTYGVRNTI